MKISTTHSLLIALLLAWLPSGHGAEESSASAPAKEKDAAPKPYPLEVCIVTDNELGSMGDEVRIVYEGQEIKFCCKPCDKKFRKNPAKYLAKLAPTAPPETGKAP